MIFISTSPPIFRSIIVFEHVNYGSLMISLSLFIYLLYTRTKSSSIINIRIFSKITKKKEMMLQILTVLAFLFAVSSAGNFSQDVTVDWGGSRAQMQNGGQVLSLSLDNVSGSGFVSNDEYLYGRFDMQLKLVPGDSAGTVTTFYLSSQGSAHDEIDFEFLGNSSGQPYTIHTNIYIQGVGKRELQFKPWFDPTTAFHTYTIIWNPQRIIHMVDNIPIRVFNNYSADGVPFPTTQPMRMYGSLWNGETWATEGGRVKTDWTKAPFTATYQNYSADGCVVSASGNSCNGELTSQAWQTQGLDANGRNQIQSIQQNYTTYDYCTDVTRFSQGLPPECKLPRF